MNSAITVVAIFLCSSLIIFILLYRFNKRRTVELRVKELLPRQYEVEEQEEHKQKVNPIKKFISSVARIFKHVQFDKRNEKLLLEAGSTLRPEEFFVMRIFVSVLVGFIGSLIGFPWFVFILTAILGYIFPNLYMKNKRKKRLKLISYQLVEILGMMANSMRAGFSFMQAMQLVGKEIPDPLGPEFDRVVRQAGLGVPLDEIFEELTERLPNKELEVVIRAILAQRKSGGNLAGLMEKMEETVRGRIRILEELNTLTAQGRMSSWIITLLPVGLAVYLYFAGGDYFRPMLEHPLGWVMLGMSSISILIGWIVIQKIIQIEV